MRNTEICDNLNVEALKTGSQSPWQNGLCECNHAVVDQGLEKILEEKKGIKLDIALAYAVNAKNCLQMWNGFSSYQLVFGCNPNLPNVMCDNPPTLCGKTSSSTFADHINTIHSARQAYISVECSERVRRVTRHKIRCSSKIFVMGDKVYYKRNDSNR